MIDDQGRLHLAVVPSDLPCCACQAPGPNLEWRLEARSGVLCRKCLSAMVEEMNRSLGAGSTLDHYQPEAGDIYLQDVYEDWFNVYRFQGRTWDYLTAIRRQEVDELTQLMHFLGESQGKEGKRRYYRPKRDRPGEPGAKTKARRTARRNVSAARRASRDC
jgi:hypothetical protein